MTSEYFWYLVKNQSIWADARRENKKREKIEKFKKYHKKIQQENKDIKQNDTI